MSLKAPLKNGTTYEDYLEETSYYRYVVNKAFTQEILQSPISSEEIKIYGEEIVKELIPKRSEFIFEEDYDEIYQETLLSLTNQFL